MNSNSVTKRILLVLPLLLILFGFAQLWAQGDFVLSKNPDFSTDDRVFTRDDTMYMKVIAPEIDFTDLEKNKFELEAAEGGDELEGKFDNLLNRTYKAKISLSTADLNEDDWKWKARIRDEGDREFRVEVQIKIAGGNEVPTAEFKGKIDVVTQESIIINGITILVDNLTNIFDENNLPIALSDLTAGDLVEVRVKIDLNDNLSAIRIRIKGESSNELEIKGSIQSLGANSLAVAGITFLVNQNTEILNDDKEPISFGSLIVGQTVEVKAIVQQDGSFLATRVNIEDDDGDEVEFTGHIDELGNERIVVNGVEFLVSGATEILDNDKNPISFSELQVGQLVEIRGERDNTGVLHATKIEIEDEEFGDDEVEITGPVSDVGENEITVLGLTFQVNNSTQILDDENRPIELSDIKAGFIVKVRADVQSDGTLLATKIKIEDQFVNEIEITGIIESIGEESITVSGIEFLVNDETEILDDDNNPIEFSDLNTNQVVEIRARVQADGTIIAIRIKLEDQFQGRVELTGTIEAIDGQTVRVSGLVFLVDGNTEILDNQNNLITFAELQVGQIVEVKGIVQTDGTILAVRIKVEDRIADEVEVTGVIEQITESIIKVLGRTFLLTGNTVIFDAEENIIDMSGLFVGQTVEIRGDLLKDGTLFAIKIKLEDSDVSGIDVVGPIDSFGPGTVEVIGIVFFLTDTTEILDKDINVIELGDLNVGQTVEILAVGQPNGTRVATRIQIVDVLLLSGIVENVVLNGIEMFGKQVLFDANTLILGKENKFLEIGDLTKGQFVEVRAKQNGGNIIFGTKVKIQNLFTSVESFLPDDEAIQPDDFVLLQNYPNPFNPSTTITFQIPDLGGSLVQARLIIYNLLGQEVRALVNQPLSSGTHQRQWDGRDEKGNVLPTGVYIYQLKAGTVSKTARMLLIK